MIFNKHSELKGKHALLSPSKSSWLRYDEDQLYQRYVGEYAASIGTALHDLAETLIRENIKLKKSDKNLMLVHLLRNGIPRNIIDIDSLFDNFMLYVNDCIGFRMTPEQILVYSDFIFGTADAIAFRNNFLRVHDYKSGNTPVKMEQLLIYAALFCLEYRIKPAELSGIELRIYQGGEIIFDNPTVEMVTETMDKIVTMDKTLQKIRTEE